MTFSVPIHMTFDVSTALPHPFTGRIATWVYPPKARPLPQTDPSLWLVCLPGGSYRGQAYYDRQVPGYDPSVYSMVRFLNQREIGCVVTDTLGTGDSFCSLPGSQITPTVNAEVNALLIHKIRQHLLQGTLVPHLGPLLPHHLLITGMGHSMGGFHLTLLADLLQQRGTPLLTAVVAGWTNGPFVGQLPDILSASLAEPFSDTASREDLLTMRRMLRPFFYRSSVPQSLIEADEADVVTCPGGVIEDLLTPGLLKEETRRLSLPILHVLAEHDLSASPKNELDAYESSPWKMLYIQPEAAHCNFERSREAYWRVVASWLHAVAEVRSHPQAERSLVLV